MMNPIELGFPKPKNAVRGKWRALYIEPILGSGERFAIGVVAINADGSDCVVVPAPGISRLYCIFDDNAELLVYVARKSLECVRKDLRHRGVDAFFSPKKSFLGIHYGGVTAGSGNSLAEIAHTGLRACSSLNNPVTGDLLEEESSAKSWKEPRLTKLLKEYIASIDDRYVGCFDIPFSARQNGGEVKRRIGFVGSRVVSNFYAISGSQPRRSEKPIQSAILNLVVHRDCKRESLLDAMGGGHQSYAMIVLRPEDNGMWSDMQLESVEELCEDLAADCRIEGIEFIPKLAVKPIGDYLLLAESGLEMQRH